jgi:hypothetical protein
MFLRIAAAAAAVAFMACTAARHPLRPGPAPVAFVAAPPDLRAHIEPNPVGIAETATYSVLLPGFDQGAPEAPDFGGLIASGPEIRTGIFAESADGQAAGLEPGVLYVWRVLAPHAGPFTIGPAHIFLRGRQLTTNPVKVTCAGDLVRSPPRPPCSQATAEPILTASLLASTVRVGEETTYLLQIQNLVEGQLRLPGFGALNVSRPTKATTTAIRAQGKHPLQTRQATLFSWKVKADSAGQYRIGAASLTNATGSFRSEPVTLIVTDGPAPK